MRRGVRRTRGLDEERLGVLAAAAVLLAALLAWSLLGGGWPEDPVALFWPGLR